MNTYARLLLAYIVVPWGIYFASTAKARVGFPENAAAVPLSATFDYLLEETNREATIHLEYPRMHGGEYFPAKIKIVVDEHEIELDEAMLTQVERLRAPVVSELWTGEAFSHLGIRIGYGVEKADCATKNIGDDSPMGPSLKHQTESAHSRFELAYLYFEIDLKDLRLVEQVNVPSCDRPGMIQYAPGKYKYSPSS